MAGFEGTRHELFLFRHTIARRHDRVGYWVAGTLPENSARELRPGPTALKEFVYIPVAGQSRSIVVKATV